MGVVQAVCVPGALSRVGANVGEGSWFRIRRSGTVSWMAFLGRVLCKGSEHPSSGLRSGLRPGSLQWQSAQGRNSAGKQAPTAAQIPES